MILMITHLPTQRRQKSIMNSIAMAKHKHFLVSFSFHIVIISALFSFMFQLKTLALISILYNDCKASPLLSTILTTFKNTTFERPPFEPLAPNAMFKDDLLKSGLQGFNVEHRKRYHVDFQFYDEANVFFDNGKVVIKAEKRNDGKIYSGR